MLPEAFFDTKKWLPCTSWLLGGGGGFYDRLRDRYGEELGDAVRHLSASADPVGDAVALELDRSGVGAGVVGADDFNGTTVARAILLNDNDAVMGLLAGAYARQTDHQHLGIPLETTMCLGEEIKRSGLQNDGTTIHTTQQLSMSDFRGFRNKRVWEKRLNTDDADRSTDQDG